MDIAHNLTMTVVEPAHPAIRRLAVLDESRPPDGPILLAEVDGLPWAALGLRDGRVVATPFQPSGDLLPVLEARAAQLRGDERRGGVGRLFEMVGAGAWRSVVRD